MSENVQSFPFFGTESAPQPLNNFTPSGRVCNISRVSTPAVSLAWVLPPTTSTSLQLIAGRAYLNPQASTTMLVELTDQRQNSTSALFYPGALKWDLTESKGNTTITDQDTTLSSLSVTAQWDESLVPNTTLPFSPTLFTNFVQVTPPQVANREYSLALPYQEGSQTYYYNYNSLGPLMPGELGQCLQPYGSVSYPASEECAPQPEVGVVEKEIQPRNLQIPLSTSDLSRSTSVQNTPDTSLLVVDTETFPGLPPSGQTLCLLESPELCTISTEVFQMRTPPVHGHGSLAGPICCPSEILALPPAPGPEQRENGNMHEVKAELSKPPDAYVGTKENQDPSHLPLVDYTDTRRLRQKSASDSASLGGIGMGLEERGELENESGSSINFEDIATLEEDNDFPQLFKTLNDIDQDPLLQNWGVMSSPSEKVRKNDLNASDQLDGAPQAKIQYQDLVEGERAMGSTGDKDGTIDKITKHLEGKAPKVAPSRHSKGRKLGQEGPSGPENNSKKTDELKQSRKRVKAEEKPTVPKTKRKRNPPELSQTSFKKPRTHLGMHMLESVQIFHPLGKKNEKKTGISSFRGLQTFTSNKPGPATPTLLDMPHGGQGFDRSPGKVPRSETSAHKECPSPSKNKMPTAGKVRLVPLPFPTLDQPQARPVSRKPLPLASHRPTAAYPVQPHSHSAHPCQLAPVNTSLMSSAKPALPISSSATRPNVGKTVQSRSVPPLAYMRPVPYRVPSHASFQRELVSAARNKAPSPPKPQTQYQLQDFSCQSIPWREVDILGPVISQPITKEQRPEREAMKRRAQQERENAAKYSCSGKLQLFLHREKDMEISQYYGYAV
ncbi:uncharacterized protein C2orf78 homolog isoform X1 [Rattus norvegicus]|nr:uncharacterized protein C2orf78 homolog isoform X1 [Rattus norvegicus]|eukprot:XP_008757499.1 PREDICTED: uncharacterized protein C2orf78 homolog isoform X1 [Rattus norvegicus]